MKSTSSEKDYLKESQDILKKTIYRYCHDDEERFLSSTGDVESMTASLLNIAQYIKLQGELLAKERELNEDE